MKKLVLLTSILIFIGFNLSAQKSKDVIYLKNGSIIFGKLIEIVDNKYKLQTSDGSIFIYDSSEVEKFAKESPFYDGRRSEGFGFALESGLLIGAQNTDYSAPFSFNFLLGFTSKTKNLISIGSGVEFIGRPYTPFFIEYKYLTNTKKTAPFLFIRGGVIAQIGGEDTPPDNYNNDFSPYNYKGGASVTLGSGISWAKEDFETYLSFAYRYAHTSYQQKEYNRGVITYESDLNRLELKFGFRF